ncbi:MAG TPA: carbohydrate kinase [Tissierellaceae bacterium]
MFDVVALGELLIDFTWSGYSSAGNVLFERNPGGAPANVLVAVSKLGGKGAFIGKVGNDIFGYFLKGVLERYNINTVGLKFSNEANTTLAFVYLDELGERSFSFYRNPGADMMLRPEDLELELLDNTKIFHFGSLSLTDEPARDATLKALEYAKSKRITVSYDPNWRPALWKSDMIAREKMSLGLEYADVLKVSKEEMEFLTGYSDLEVGSKSLFDRGAKLVVITLGAKGCYYRHVSGTGHVSTYDVKVVDTTGAGDAFWGAVLYCISRLEYSLDKLNSHDIEKIMDFANAAGALCVSRKGAIPAMPSLEEIKYCQNNIPRLCLR